jgi:hypothetical protein
MRYGTRSSPDPIGREGAQDLAIEPPQDADHGNVDHDVQQAPLPPHPSPSND